MIEQIVLVGLIIGLTQIIKETGKVSKQWIPFVAIFFGVLINLMSGWAGADIVIGGIIAGLISMGMWSGTNRVTTKETEQEKESREQKVIDNNS